ncbi:g-protein coupled receptor 98 [Trichonephila clavata]|uniref:G-protein coupled receptor 98 n=1 Tax=Trichonephila clavata TaxID=2740835 RepID=A0A8X6GTK2_TRICU|nr:g-protein coupled receptor 98 [Trichonephila clavata]
MKAMTPGTLELDEPIIVVSEGVRQLQVGVNRVGGTDGQIRCRYRTIPKTALPGVDYEPSFGEVIFEPGETRHVIKFRIINDHIREPLKHFQIELFDAQAAPGVLNFRGLGTKKTSLVTIADDDLNMGTIQFEKPTYRFHETIGKVLINVVRVGGSDGQIKVRYMAKNRTALEFKDFEPASGVLTFKENETKKTIPITIINDHVKEPSKSFDLVLYDAVPSPNVIHFGGLGANSVATITVLDDDGK